MKKSITDLFEPFDFLSNKSSTLEQRQEIYTILFEKNLIFYQEHSIEQELILLKDYSVYIDDLELLFLPDFSNGCGEKEVSYEEFKQRLNQL